MDEWGISSRGTNQGIEHFYNKEINRINGLAERLGVPKDDFSISEKGFKNFTSQAKRVVSEATKQGNVISEENGKKMIYYIKGANGSRKGVQVIMYEGKIQSMMPFKVPKK